MSHSRRRGRKGERYSVLWVDPETGATEVYLWGLSRARAEALAFKVAHVLSPHWYGVEAAAWMVAEHPDSSQVTVFTQIYA